MKLPAATNFAPALQFAEQNVLHRCPVCHTHHAVSAARAEMAYGRQLCCSPDCEGERRRQARRGCRLMPAS
jgi:hypothetical protein